MLYLKKIALFQFKNYHNRDFAFTSRITGICGKNGSGKTNLLDAIHYLCFTRSYFSRLDSLSVRQGDSGFRLAGFFELEGKEEKAVCILRENGKKEFLVNDTLYDKFSFHIGRYPCVIIAPDDIRIISNGSEERRRFIDSLLSQLDPEYLQQLIFYNKVLQQRNSLLKSFSETAKPDYALLDVLDAQLVAYGTFVFEKRKDFMVSFLPAIKQQYMEIAGQYEDVTLLYESELFSGSFAELLNASRHRDILLQRTTSGVHRDEMDIRLGKQGFKNIASQGQRKSLLFAMKLAEMKVLRASKGFAPLLLLDDVFEKLDEDRIAGLLRKVCVENEGQVFITDTHCERLGGYLSPLRLTFETLQL